LVLLVRGGEAGIKLVAAYGQSASSSSARRRSGLGWRWRSGTAAA